MGLFPVFYFYVRFGLIAVPATRRDRGATAEIAAGVFED